MIKSFTVSDMSTDDFIAKVNNLLAERDLGKIVSVSVVNQSLTIAFSKLGKSELTYSLSSLDKGFKCAHSAEKIALTHRPLRGEIESKLTKVLEKLGAQVEVA